MTSACSFSALGAGWSICPSCRVVSTVAFGAIEVSRSALNAVWILLIALMVALFALRAHADALNRLSLPQLTTDEAKFSDLYNRLMAVQIDLLGAGKGIHD